MPRGLFAARSPGAPPPAFGGCGFFAARGARPALSGLAGFSRRAARPGSRAQSPLFLGAGARKTALDPRQGQLFSSATLGAAEYAFRGLTDEGRRQGRGRGEGVAP